MARLARELSLNLNLSSKFQTLNSSKSKFSPHLWRNLCFYLDIYKVFLERKASIKDEFAKEAKENLGFCSCFYATLARI